MKEYTTANGNIPDELDAKVNALIKQGFQPYGNPYTVSKDDYPCFCQAMVKEISALKPEKTPSSKLFED